MKREELELLLDDYVDGELDGELGQELERRLAESPEVGRQVERYRAMIAGLRDLPEAIEPRRDLWPEIERRIEVQDGRRTDGPGSWLLAASIALLVVGVAFVSGWLSGRGSTPPPTLQSLDVETGPSLRQASVVVEPRHALSHAEADLLRATSELRQALDNRRQALPPETLQLVDNNLRIVEAAIAEIHTALAGDPANPELNKMLLAYYQRELSILEQVSRAASKL